MKSFAVVLLTVGLAACSLMIPKESQYLKSAQDRATQEEVRQQLGTPRSATSTPDGEAVWTYEVRQIEPGSQNTWATAGSWCDEYVLRFDNQQILRQWSHKSFFHGGELMPISCNSVMGVQKAAF
jgi:hypothetical protein